MNPSLLSLAIASGLFIGILACAEFGYRTGRRATEKHPEWAHEGVGVIEAAVFALLGLLLGFSFSGGTSRLDDRRQLVINEANAIGTAYLRLDLLPVLDQPEMRRLFHAYLDARLGVYEALPDVNAAQQQIDLSNKLQAEIWRKSVDDASRDPSHDAARLLLPALNEMFDVTTARNLASHTASPPDLCSPYSCRFPDRCSCGIPHGAAPDTQQASHVRLCGRHCPDRVCGKGPR